MLNEPKVSIIIPVYKVENYISRCIESLQAQTLKELEFIFVDDCGNDNSVAIVQKYSEADARIKIIYNESNLGSGKSRNRGIDAATGEYIAFVDGDDWLDCNFYEVLYERAKGGDYDIVKGRRVRVTHMEDGRVTHGESRVNIRIIETLRKKIPLYCVFTSEHQSAIFKRDMVHKYQIYYGSSSHSENSVFLLSAAFHAKRFCIDARVVYYYFQRDNSCVHVFDYKMFAGELDSFKQQILFLKNTVELQKDQNYLFFLERKIKYLLRRYEIIQNVPELKPFRKNFVQTLINEISQIENGENLRKHGLNFQLLLDGKTNTFIVINRLLPKLRPLIQKLRAITSRIKKQASLKKSLKKGRSV